MKKTFKIIVQNLLAYVSLNVFRGGQELVYTKIRDAIINGYRTMYIEGPTGMGKSFIQSTLADALINGSDIKVLLLVPKITLLSQMKREFIRFSKHLHLAMFGGGKKDHGKQVTIMTYQSFLNVSSQILKQYTIIFLDEAHKALGDMTRSKIEEQTHAIVIGFTATPNYSEKKNLKEFLKHEVYRISIPEAVKVGMLSPIQFIIGKVNIEVSGKQRNETTEEYKERLGKDIIREGGNIAAVKLYKKLFEKRGTRFAAFTASIAQGYDLVREFRENGVDAEIITGTTKLGDRENLFDDFNKNKFKILVSIDVLKEGFDDPGMHGVMFVYPVGSKVDLIQGAGRGTRIDDNDPNKVAFIVQLAFQTRKQVWYNDALEGKGPFVSPDEFGDIELKKVKHYNLVTSDELQDISDEIIESVSVEHEEVLSLIKGYSKDITKEHILEELKKIGIYDYESLIHFNPHIFAKTSFGVYGKGNAFVSKIIRYCPKGITKETFLEIEKHLNWEEPSDLEKLENWKNELKKFGITDYQSLIKYRFIKFQRNHYGFYGQGMTFASEILGRSSAKILKDDLLNEIANCLGWEKTAEENFIEKVKIELAKHGIVDYLSIVNFPTVKFRDTEFGECGPGVSVYRVLIGHKTKYISKNHLEEIAKKLEWKKITRQEQLQSYKIELAKHGIVDYESLILCGTRKIQRINFGMYGQGKSFLTNILGTAVSVRLDTLQKAAKVLGWKKKDDLIKLQEWKIELAKHGIVDYDSLKNFGSKEFKKTEFGIYGTGTTFGGMIIGKTIPYVTFEILDEIANNLNWKK